jgi:hypothetical protein
MKESFYFAHDYHARADRKLVKLAMKHKMEGLGVFWCLIEMLYEESGYLPTEYEGIAFALHTDTALVESVVNNFGLFTVNCENFYSESVLERIKLRQEKSEKARESANKGWDIRKGKDANALRTHSSGNAIKERKGKESYISK